MKIYNGPILFLQLDENEQVLLPTNINFTPTESKVFIQTYNSATEWAGWSLASNSYFSVMLYDLDPGIYFLSFFGKDSNDELWNINYPVAYKTTLTPDANYYFPDVATAAGTGWVDTAPSASSTGNILITTETGQSTIAATSGSEIYVLTNPCNYTDTSSGQIVIWANFAAPNANSFSYSVELQEYVPIVFTYHYPNTATSAESIEYLFNYMPSDSDRKNIEIIIVDEDYNYIASGVTDDLGMVTIMAPIGKTMYAILKNANAVFYQNIFSVHYPVTFIATEYIFYNHDTPDATCNLTGKIVNIGGYPLGNVHIVITPINRFFKVTSTGSIAVGRVETLTGSDGSFSIALLKGIKYRFAVESSMFYTEFTMPDTCSGDVDFSTLTLEQPDYFKINGLTIQPLQQDT